MTNAAPHDASAWVVPLREAGARRWRVDFCIRRYSSEDAAAIWDKLKGL